MVLETTGIWPANKDMFLDSDFTAAKNISVWSTLSHKI